MHCPKCGVEKKVKNGFVQEIQRYKCKVCGCQYTREDVRGRPIQQRLIAITLYSYGLSMNAIGTLLGVSTPGILDWIRRYASRHYQKLVPQGSAVILELDEMWHYLEKKHKNSGYGKYWIAIQDNCLSGNVVIEAQKH